MNPLNVEKTALGTPMGNFRYTAISFNVKNAGATYQGAMTAMFCYMLHDCLDYVDDIVVKFKKKHHDTKYWGKSLPDADTTTCGWTLWTFSVYSEKFLGFAVHRKGTNLNLAKAKAIQNMGSPTTCKQLTSFMGKVSYVCRFIQPWRSSSNHSTNCSKRTRHLDGVRSSSRLSKRLRMFSARL